MASVARSGWRRARSSIAGAVAEATSGAVERELAIHGEREVEILRQMSDVLQELGRLSGDVGVARDSLEEAKAGVRELTVVVQTLAASLAEMRQQLEAQMEAANETTEILGRLLASARSRLEALEDAAGSPR